MKNLILALILTLPGCMDMSPCAITGCIGDNDDLARKSEEASMSTMDAAEPDEAAQDLAMDASPPSDLSKIDKSWPTPSTCAEWKQANPNATDGEIALLHKGTGKMWMAFCHDEGGTEKEYLTLPMAGPNTNFSQYTAGGSSPGTDVRTNYLKIRINPQMLLVEVGNQTFASSMGMLVQSGGMPISSIGYGSAASCVLGNGTGIANINLHGTPFSVAPNAFSVGPPASNNWHGTATYGAQMQTVDLVGGAFCGYYAPGPPGTYGQFDGPFNGLGGFTLQLQFM